MCSKYIFRLHLMLICVQCSPPPSPTQALNLGSYCAPLRVYIDLPDNWDIVEGTHSCLLTAPEHSPAYFTPIALQSLPVQASLGQTLEKAYEPIRHFTNFNWNTISTAVYGSGAGLSYRVSFEHHEAQRIKVGFIMFKGQEAIDMTYSANQEIYGENLMIFDHIVHSLSFDIP
jgi:hypothetical protein